MSELKRTQLYDVHVAAGASMVDFGGWEMPIQYPSGIVAEHLYTRHACSLFDVSHMGRVLVEGPDRVAFLQHVLSSNVESLDLNMAQYCIIPTENGSAVDDAYLYRFEEERFLLVVNAANTEKDLAHLREAMKNYNCTMTEITKDWAAIAVQGPKCKDILMTLSGGVQLTEPMKNALGTVTLEGRLVRVAKTGYTGEPLGFEVYCRSEDAAWLWNRLVELGAKPAGLGARDTLRLEAALPLYGHEMGLDPAGNEMPIFAVPLAKFAVSFAPQKGDFIGRKPLVRAILWQKDVRVYLDYEPPRFRRNTFLADTAEAIDTLRQMAVTVCPYFAVAPQEPEGTDLVTEADVLDAAKTESKTIRCRSGAIITPAARDALAATDVILRYEGETTHAAS